jgi:Domain of unknown function (DUF4177)
MNPLMTWEYRYCHAVAQRGGMFYVDGQPVPDFLNAAGRQGWELVSFAVLSQTSGRIDTAGVGLTRGAIDTSWPQMVLILKRGSAA